MTIRALRRLTLPLWLAVAAVALAAAPAIALGARLLGMVTRRPEPVAAARLLYVYLTGELAVLADAARLGRENASGERVYVLLARFLDDLVGAAMHSLRLGLHVEVEAAAEQVLREGDRPVLVFSRHAGPGDSVLLLHLLLTRFDRRPRIVMKEILGLDPVVGLVGDRLPNALIDQRADDACDAIEQLATGLGGRDAVVLFPEGGNFTEKRRRAAIAWLRRRGLHVRARRAAALEHMIAPRPGGALAALRGAPDASVVFAAHTGLGLAARGLDILRALPHDGTVRMRLWLAPPEERPVGEDELVEWLDAWWARLDGWVEEQGQE